jgi:putative ABC transport system permease protein
MPLENWLYTVPLRLRSLFRRKRVEAELDEEMRYHLQRQTEVNIAAGMSEEEARYASLRAMHGLEQQKERCRDARRVRVIEDLWHDFRFGLRMVIKNPFFTIVIVLTLALGIGANSAIFSIVNAVLLRPFPFDAPERLVILQESLAAGGGFSPSYPNYVDWRAQNTVCSSMAAVRSDESFNFTDAGDPERLQGRLVTSEFFSTLGIKPLVGRDFLADEDRQGATPTAILSYRFWERRFGADRNILGKQLTLNNQSFTVIGVTPPDFQFGEEADVTVPIGLQAERFKLRGKDPGVDVVARLKSHVSEQQAETQLNLIAARLEQQYPESNKGRHVLLTPLYESFVGDARRPLLILQGAVGLVLLIACANVANLLLVRAAARQKEMAVRVALGASRIRLIRQLLTESVLLAAFGTTLGILLAFWLTSFIASEMPNSIPRLRDANVDAWVLVFTFAVSLLTAVLFGLVPALQASRPKVTLGLKEGQQGSSGSRQRLSRLLVVSEVALTLALLVGAGLLIQSFRHVLQVDPGFNAQNLLTMQLSVNNSDGQQVANFFKQLLENVRHLPGVKSVAVSDGLPFDSANYPAFIIEGRPLQKKPSGLRYSVSPDYFQTMGIGLIRGRLFGPEDTRDSQPVVIINDILAQRYFPSEDPLGKRLKQSPDSPSLEIVGIVRHAEHYKLEAQRAQNQFYLNFNQTPLQSLPENVGYMNLLVRTEVEPPALAAAVRAQVTALNKDQPVFNVRTMEEILAQSVAARRFSLLLLTFFASVALGLASLGIYGLMSYAVAQRKREIGVRMALGAQATDVLKLVIRQGMKLAFLGVALGLVASLALTRTMKSLLFGVSAADPLTFAALALLLITVALLACFIPARRAAKVDSVIALRSE